METSGDNVKNYYGGINMIGDYSSWGVGGIFCGNWKCKINNIW